MKKITRHNKSNDEVAPEIAAIIRTVRKLSPDGPLTLTEVSSDGMTTTIRGFGSDWEPKLTAYLGPRLGERNLALSLSMSAHDLLKLKVR